MAIAIAFETMQFPRRHRQIFCALRCIERSQLEEELRSVRRLNAGFAASFEESLQTCMPE